MAMMCRTRLMRRLPARESRWRCWSPEDTSIGAVPFQDAKCPAEAKRWMPPMSPTSRAAPDGPGESFLRPGGDQLEQQPVDAVEGLGANAAEFVAAVHHQAQRDARVISDDAAQARTTQASHRDAVRVHRVGFAALPGIEHPHPGRQLGRDVDDDFTIGDQALSDVAADTG